MDSFTLLAFSTPQQLGFSPAIGFSLLLLLPRFGHYGNAKQAGQAAIPDQAIPVIVIRFAGVLLPFNDLVARLANYDCGIFRRAVLGKHPVLMRFGVE